MKLNKKQRQAMLLGKQMSPANKQKVCVACNGSGRYDTKGSPKCQCCNGTGYLAE